MEKESMIKALVEKRLTLLSDAEMRAAMREQLANFFRSLDDDQIAEEYKYTFT